MGVCMLHGFAKGIVTDVDMESQLCDMQYPKMVGLSDMEQEMTVIQVECIQVHKCCCTTAIPAIHQEQRLQEHVSLYTSITSTIACTTYSWHSEHHALKAFKASCSHASQSSIALADLLLGGLLVCFCCCCSGFVVCITCPVLSTVTCCPPEPLAGVVGSALCVILVLLAFAALRVDDAEASLSPPCFSPTSGSLSGSASGSLLGSISASSPATSRFHARNMFVKDAPRRGGGGVYPGSCGLHARKGVMVTCVVVRTGEGGLFFYVCLLFCCFCSFFVCPYTHLDTRHMVDCCTTTTTMMQAQQWLRNQGLGQP